MVRLKQRDMREILEFMRGAYEIHSIAQYAHYVTNRLGRLIGANYVSYNEVDLHRHHNVVIVDRPEAVAFRGYWDGVFDVHLSEHPVVDHFVRTGQLDAMKISDFLSRRQFHGLGLYQEFFRHVRTEYQLAAAVVAGPGHLVDIGLNRTRPDFSERDRLVFNILRRHLAGAHRNVQHVTAIAGDLELVLAGAGEVDAGVVILRPDGAIRLASARARRLIDSYFGATRAGGRGLPDAVARWVRHEDQRLSGHHDVAQPAHPLVVDHHDRRLIVRLLLTADRAVLVLREEMLDVDAGSLEALPLSRREAEVLAWVAKGKTDAEVATIVGIRPRTVGKHLERIYQKLGVENRTAAAAQAFAAAARGRSPS